MFHNALVKAAEAAFEAGEIDRLDLWRVRFAMLSPRARRMAEQFAIDHAKEHGIKLPKSSNGAFDWSALLAFLQALLPLILQLIG